MIELQDTTRIIHDDFGHEHTYVCGVFYASEGVALQARLGKVLGKLASVEGVAGVLRQLLEVEGVDLFLDLLTVLDRDGEEITEELFEVIYAGNYGEMYAAAAFVIQVNFEGLIQRLPFDLMGLDEEDEEGKESILSKLEQFISGSPLTSPPDSTSTTLPEDSDSTPLQSDESGPSSMSLGDSTS